jgi:hypothetical protein
MDRKQFLLEIEKDFKNKVNPTELMNILEKKFKIPCYKDEDYNKNNKDVISLYIMISNSRVF